MIYGIGIEAIDVERFARALRRRGERLRLRLFTPGELDYCLAKRHSEMHLAARFAAKVSVRRALNMAIGYRDIEITMDPAGRPCVEARGAEGFELSLSITHDGNLSLAQTIAQRTKGTR